MVVQRVRRARVTACLQYDSMVAPYFLRKLRFVCPGAAAHTVLRCTTQSILSYSDVGSFRSLLQLSVCAAGCGLNCIQIPHGGYFRLSPRATQDCAGDISSASLSLCVQIMTKFDIFHQQHYIGTSWLNADHDPRIMCLQAIFSCIILYTYCGTLRKNERTVAV